MREYFVVRDVVHFCVDCGCAVPDEDEEMFATIPERFEALDAA